MLAKMNFLNTILLLLLLPTISSGAITTGVRNSQNRIITASNDDNQENNNNTNNLRRLLLQLTIAILGECEGNCDSSTDCDWGLNCFERTGIEPVPGCEGEGVSGKNYCYVPPSGDLVLMGDNSNPASAFPLQQCQGDCDNDTNCDWGLNCYQRSGTEAVPGCQGDGVSGKDYCYVPSAGELVLMGDNNNPAEAFPLLECQGDCDNDLDCDWGLICFQRDGTESAPGCTGQGARNRDYCVIPSPGTLVLVQGDNNNGSASPLGLCEGVCVTDSDCEGDLVCFERVGDEAVPGCSGAGVSGHNYCVAGTPPAAVPTASPTDAPTKSPTKNPTKSPTESPSASPSQGSTENYLPLNDIGNGLPERSYGQCEGDCDSSRDCDWGLNCFERSGTESVPGCSGTGISGNDYCYVPPPLELVLVGNNNNPESAFPLRECQADCDNDSDCDAGLICFQRTGDEPVPGCTGAGLSTEDYCIKPPPGMLVNVGNNGNPAGFFPLGECQGDCDNDGECMGSLRCFQRSGFEEVPGCTGTGTSGTDYCYNPNPSTNPPTVSPSPTNPPPDGSVTYVPGEGTVYENGLLLSTGLTSRIIATKNTYVQYDTGGQSSELFHTAPDGGAVFKDSNTGGWIYVSNSESNSDGGVGAITFDSTGQVVGYKRILSGTKRNCGGGKSFWNTWITCEEVDGGQVWEVDPWGNSPGRQTIMGGAGMNYESAAYDNRDVNNPIFFLTVDEPDGPLIRFIPDPSAVTYAVNNNDYSNLLHATGPGVKYEYFVVTSIGADGKGTYEWSTSLSAGRSSGASYHQNGEGVDVRNGELFYTAKTNKYLYIIDLDNGNFTRTSTVSGAFDSQPDQVARVLDFTDGTTDGILYFCEDGGDNCGVHGRDAQGRYFTILQDAGANFGGETTGLAFSPDGMFMYVSFQVPGYIFEIRRLDGYPFQGSRLDIKYHQSGDNESPFRELELYEDNAKTCDLVSSSCSMAAADQGGLV